MSITLNRFKFDKTKRLNRPEQFEKLFAEGQRFFFKPGMFITIPNGLTYARLGQVIAKKKLKTASARNYLKRIQREFFRHHQADLAGFDILFVASNSVATIKKTNLYALCQQNWQVLCNKLSASAIHEK